ncbi:hypothetical protein ACTJI8_14490 [Microbacterium sp. 22303]|uniref:hypothetical protein n=1 Tax=Microbacterium sp. 22303 TaxID=3453905 RepID=UPI003F87807B
MTEPFADDLATGPDARANGNWGWPFFVLIGVAAICAMYTTMDTLNIDGCGEGECNYMVAWWSTVGFVQILFWFVVACGVAMILLTLLGCRASWIAFVGIGVSIVATIISNSIFGWSLHAGS